MYVSLVHLSRIGAMIVKDELARSEARLQSCRSHPLFFYSSDTFKIGPNAKF